MEAAVGGRRSWMRDVPRLPLAACCWPPSVDSMVARSIVTPQLETAGGRMAGGQAKISASVQRSGGMWVLDSCLARLARPPRAACLSCLSASPLLRLCRRRAPPRQAVWAASQPRTPLASARTRTLHHQATRTARSTRTKDPCVVEIQRSGPLEALLAAPRRHLDLCCEGRLASHRSATDCRPR